MQTAIVSPVFDKIYYAMFDTTNPLRQPNLRGIQLVENLEPKKKKAKTVNPTVQETKSDSSSDSTLSTDIPETSDQSDIQ